MRIPGLNSDHLQPLDTLVKETVFASKADGSVRSYLPSFKLWKRWASYNYLCHMPAKSFQVTVYLLQCLILEANSPPPILNAVYSIDWAQQLAGLPKVSDYPVVFSLVAASQRILGKTQIEERASFS